jgi:preprotein translocase subunit SecG
VGSANIDTTALSRELHGLGFTTLRSVLVFGFLLVLLLIDGVLLSIIVLLQSGKGGGLAAMGGASAGTDSLIGGRQAATLLTKATWVTGGLFLFLAVALSVLSSRAQRPQSVLRGLQQQQAPAAAPQPIQIPGTKPAQPGAQPATGAPAPGGTQAPAGGTTPQTQTGGTGGR